MKTIDAPSPNVSDRYKFLSTEGVINELGSRGWEVTAKIGKSQYGRHEIRFKNPSLVDMFPGHLGLVPEIKFINGHDGHNSAQSYVGILRQVCQNGLVATKWDGSRHRHTGDVVEWSKTMIEHFMRNTDQVRETIITASERESNEEFRKSLIERVYSLRKWDEPTVSFFPPKREEDKIGSIWTDFNVAQEYAIRGGRELTAVGTTLKINVALWEELETAIR